MIYLISCMVCSAQLPQNFNWYICDKCNFRVCPACLMKHSGPYSRSGGMKCSQCAWGHMQRKK
jgi:hypothetical protein